ncbi:hypothetical protein Glove_67g54 [Diversispora epigaea]|uniref:Uncharacterized protein n=1 Tax=Diversispora epigaea TaxID=1348612 RepID=A0A397JAB7_9GLOM|nr:hypothetical protein Glove_67g54 [Diversispora epigaea]
MSNVAAIIKQRKPKLIIHELRIAERPDVGFSGYLSLQIHGEKEKSIHHHHFLFFSSLSINNVSKGRTWIIGLDKIEIVNFKPLQEYINKKLLTKEVVRCNQVLIVIINLSAQYKFDVNNV